jgi:hypothetical protein
MGFLDQDMFARVRVTKTEDLVFGGNHPNGIGVGTVREGYCFRVPRPGEALALWPRKIKRMGDVYSVFLTSHVTEFKLGEIRTENSVYVIEVESFTPDGVPFFEKMDPAVWKPKE